MNDDDSDFDDDGVLRDSRRYRVPMKMADAANVRDYQAQLKPRDSNQYPRPPRGPTVVDSVGGRAGLHAPGWRREVGGNVGDKRVRDGDHLEARRAYACYDQWLTNAWQDPDGPIKLIDEQEGDACTVKGSEYPDDFGGPGHLQLRGNKLVCVPDRTAWGSTSDRATVIRDHQERTAHEIRRYNGLLQTQWRVR